MSSENIESSKNYASFITIEDVKTIIQNGGDASDNFIENYVTYNASDKMLGFLADYLKLKVYLCTKLGERKILFYFIKAVSKMNSAKADMVREMRLFEKEINFYTIVKRTIEVPGIKSWSAKFIATINEAIVFEDMNSMAYKTKNKFATFDIAHTQQALQMLARFHASSIIYEQKKRKQLQKPYKINDDFDVFLDKGGYDDSSPWFVQCMTGALVAIQNFSKYNEDENIMAIIEKRWEKIWMSALNLSNYIPGSCNVICHRDLWNNNILFHYETVNNILIPDDCIMVDFQAVRCQPPAGDVMQLLYCNLATKFREDNMDMFLHYYHKELSITLANYRVHVNEILSLEDFLKTAERQRLWALVTSACLVPQFWLDDDLTKDIFCNTELFNNVLSKDKASFIKNMILANDGYRQKVMDIFEEIVYRYCI